MSRYESNRPGKSGRPTGSNRSNRSSRARTGGGAGDCLGGISLMLFILSLSVVLVLNARWLYYLDITLLNIEKECGMAAAQIKANFDTLIRYNHVWYRGALVFPTLKMSEHGAIHFMEVKRIFDAIQILCAVSGIFSLAAILRVIRKGRRNTLRITGVLTLVLPAIVGAACAINWDRMFVTFHHIFFRNDYWLFDPATDPVILMLPDAYFLHCAVGIVLLAVAGAVICLLAGRERRA